MSPCSRFMVSISWIQIWQLCTPKHIFGFKQAQTHFVVFVWYSFLKIQNFRTKFHNIIILCFYGLVIRFIKFEMNVWQIMILSLTSQKFTLVSFDLRCPRNFYSNHLLNAYTQEKCRSSEDFIHLRLQRPNDPIILLGRYL